ncbi:MAG TPA: hypothetical protein VM716_14920 [Gemmatimonadales bacterium]|nr:hypothetical protein [Gemmatimonadales bacterium]
MHRTFTIAAAVSLIGATAAHAQRPFRVGPIYSTLSLQDLSGSSHAFSSWGGSAALITGDEGETGLSIARYGNLSTDGRVRRMTLFGLDSHYYPVGTRGIVAPFAGSTLGLARVAESASLCTLLTCSDTVSTTSQFALAFGLGLRVNVGSHAAATIEGRFLEVPSTQIQALEAVATASVTLGGVRKGEFLAGTVGPIVSAFIPVSGPLRARAPLAGVRFRRDTKKAGAVAVQIDYAPLKVTTSGCSAGCEASAIMFAPGYEASARPDWGRVYAVAGFLLAGVYTQGSDRGVMQGAHGGVGVDLYRGQIMWNLNARLLWLQRNTGENVFGVQVGLSLSPRVGALH